MKRSTAILCLTLLAPAALAHKPTISDGTATTPDAAITFTDIDISRVVYHEVTAQSPTLWIRFQIDGPQSVYVSLGLPVIERLRDFRPAFAVLGPGLPAVELPFAVPDGLGGLVFRTDDVTDPEVFYEPFSRTSSWILREDDVDLPAAGTYYIVAFVPSGETGKLWLAPGDREVFTLADILGLSGVLGDVRAFHEVSGASVPCFLFPLAAALLIWFLPLRLARVRRNRAHRLS